MIETGVRITVPSGLSVMSYCSPALSRPRLKRPAGSTFRTSCSNLCSRATRDLSCGTIPYWNGSTSRVYHCRRLTQAKSLWLLRFHLRPFAAHPEVEAPDDHGDDGKRNPPPG